MGKRLDFLKTMRNRGNQPKTIFDNYDVSNAGLQKLFNYELGLIQSAHLAQITDLVQQLILFTDDFNPNNHISSVSKGAFVELFNNISTIINELSSVTDKKDHAPAAAVDYAKKCLSNQLGWLLKEKPEGLLAEWYADSELNNIVSVEDVKRNHDNKGLK